MSPSTTNPLNLLSGDTRRRWAFALIAIAATIWGGLGVLAKGLFAWGVTPWSVIFFRSALGFLICGLLVLMVDRSWVRVRGRDVPFLVMYALVGTSVFFVLYLFTLSVTAVAVAVVLLYTAPAMAAVMAHFAFGEALTPSKMTALVLSFGGCVLVAGLGLGEPAVSLLGVAAGLGSALTYASFGIMSKKIRQRYSPWTTQIYALGFGTLFLLPLLALPEVSLGPYPAQVWLLLAVVAAGPTMLARMLYVTAVKHVEASRAAIVATIEPVAASLFAFLLLGETLSPTQWLGGFMVLVGAVLAQSGGGEPKRRGEKGAKLGVQEARNARDEVLVTE